MLKLRRWLVVRGVYLLLAGAALACGSAKTTGPDPVLRANQQLEGQWLLREFTPQASLEAFLAQLLRTQFGTLVVKFSGGQFTATGPGVDARGRYQISIPDAVDNGIDAILYDSEGVPHHMSGRFDGPLIRFRSLDTPWEGTGTLERNPG
jgi:hypothetical protein